MIKSDVDSLLTSKWLCSVSLCRKYWQYGCSSMKEKGLRTFAKRLLALRYGAKSIGLNHADENTLACNNLSQLQEKRML